MVKKNRTILITIGITIVLMGWVYFALNMRPWSSQAASVSAAKECLAGCLHISKCSGYPYTSLNEQEIAETIEQLDWSNKGFEELKQDCASKR